MDVNKKHKRKEYLNMSKYDREMRKEEERPMSEIATMKFSFKKLLKVMELNALLTYKEA